MAIQEDAMRRGAARCNSVIVPEARKTALLASSTRLGHWASTKGICVQGRASGRRRHHKRAPRRRPRSKERKHGLWAAAGVELYVYQICASLPPVVVRHLPAVAYLLGSRHAIHSHERRQRGVLHGAPNPPPPASLSSAKWT
jgi:hypothetical protein